MAVEKLTVTPALQNGHRKFFVIWNALIRLCWAITMKDETASTIFDTLHREWISRFGLPERFLSDHDRSR